MIAASTVDADIVTAACRRARPFGDVPAVTLCEKHARELCLAVLRAGAEDGVPATDPLELPTVRGVGYVLDVERDDEVASQPGL